MSSKTLFVWLAAVIVCVSTAFLPSNIAFAQLQFGDPEILCIDTGGEPGVDLDTDEILLTVTATYSQNDYLCTDSTRVGLDPNPGLGVLTPSLVAAETFNCPTDPVTGLYVMSSTMTPNTNLNGNFQPGVCLVTAHIQFHPECASALTNDWLPFNITWRVYNTVSGYTCVQRPDSVRATCDIETDCCIYLAYSEHGGFRYDGIIAIGDSVWIDSANVAFLDTLNGAGGTFDTVYADLSPLTGAIADTAVAMGDTIEVQAWLRENLIPACTDTIKLYRKEWASGEDWLDPAEGTVTDTIICVRQVDNFPPELEAAWIDSCRIINGNYFDNDTLVGCGDILRIYMTTLNNGAGHWNGIDARGTATDVYQTADGSPSCANVRANFDVDYIVADLSHLAPIIGGDHRFPFNTAFDDPADTIALLSTNPDSVLISMSFYDPAVASANNYLYLDIPIDTTNWDSIEWCLLDEIIAGDGYVIDVYCADDAGNLSPVVTPAGDTTGALLGWDVCFDTWAPELPGTNIVYETDFCTKRFSPYDSALISFYTNISPDSILWYLDLVGDQLWENPLNDVYMIGFDVRAIPDDEPDTPTGSIVAVLDYYHPVAEPDSDNWEYIAGPTPQFSGDAAIFTWYGKDGPDSLDPDLGILVDDYCPWGMHVGITEARYMDAAGCNAVLGSDHDEQTSISDGYTQLNNLYAVVDSCAPDVVAPTDILHLNTVLGPDLPYGPAYAPEGLGPNDTYLWVNGDPEPVLEFRAERFYQTGLIDLCLVEELCYRIKVDTVVTYTPWTSAPGGTDSSVYQMSHSWLLDPYDENPDMGYIVGDTLCTSLPFEFNDIYTDSVRIRFPAVSGMGGQLADGLYKLTLEVVDNAGNVYIDPLYIWLNGQGPVIDSTMIVNTLYNCHTNFFIGEELGVWLQTDTTCDHVVIDWSCLYGIDPANDTLIVSSYYDQDIGNNARYWYGSILVTADMINTVDDSRNYYEISPWEADCENAANLWIIGVTAFDAEGNYTEADPTHSCDKAILGLSRCPRIVGLPTLHFYNPDSLFDEPPLTPASFVDVEYDTFDVMPWWNAISPGSIDSAGAYNSQFNPAADDLQDSIFVRLLIDTLSITPPTGLPADTVFHDTLVVQFYNPTLDRTREIRKPLFIPTAADMSPFDWPFNEIYDGRIEIDETNPAFVEFYLQWNGSWYLGAGEDSLMLVPPMDQDTIIIRAFTIDGDSFTVDINSDTTYLICDTVIIDLDVDNINPDFVDHTLIAPGLRDPETHSTSTIENLGWNGDCGYRYAEGDTFSVKVVVTEQVHFDPTGLGEAYGHCQDGGGDWMVNGKYWNAAVIDTIDGELYVFTGDTIKAYIDDVQPVDLGNGNWEYTLVGHFENIPPATFIYDACLLVRGAWDQAGNPGRWNNPVFDDAFDDDSFEDYTFRIELIDCYIWAGCPDVYGPDMIMGWIAPEDTNITVWATIIETCEITECSPGVKADSALRVQGDFQTITDDPDPWVLPVEVGPWFIYVDPVTDDTIGWARQYRWHLRADSSDLATIYCDGDYLPFLIRFESVMGVDTTALFEYCVQVDVNEPIWTTATVHDTDFVFIDDVPNLAVCISPEEPFWIRARFTEREVDLGPGGECDASKGVGVDLTQIWADLSIITQNAANDSIVPDSIEYDTLMSGGFAWWLVTADPLFYCLNETDPILRFHALHDSIGHHDRELYMQDTLRFCSDCLPPYLGSATAFCDCGMDTLFHQSTELALECLDLPLGYLRPGEPWSLTICLYDVNGDSSIGLEYVAGNYQMDASPFDPMLGWITPVFLDTFNAGVTISGNYMAVASYGNPCGYPGITRLLNETYNNGDTIFTRFRFEDRAGNFDTTGFVAVAIVDTMPALVDFVYTIGDDSIRAYVTPGDEHVHIYADITGGAFDLVSPPIIEEVWADMSNFWCGGDTAEWYDTVYAHEVVQMGPNWWRAYWGWTPSGVYQIFGDTLSQLTDTLMTSLELGGCVQPGAEGWFDTLYFYVNDQSCQVDTAYSIFEVSGVDSTTPAIDSVWVWGNHCGTPGWISSTPMDSGHIEVWAWMDTVFNEIADTIKIDSLQINLAQLSAARWGWTQWSSSLEGGWELEGVTEVDSTFWAIETDGAGRSRLV
ncbi:hypothetical protein KKH18_14325, partial [bacterium]|nr:hypothetical protein [bacterium]